MAADLHSDLEKFFGQLPPLPGKKEKNCPPDSVLCEAANGKIDERCQAHIAECKNCAAVVNLLREAAEAPGERLQQFLALTKAKAQETVADRENNWAEAAWAWISLGRGRQVLAYGTVASLLLIGVSVSYRQYYDHRQPNRFQLTLGEDENQKAFERSVNLLQASIENLNKKKVNSQNIHAQVDDINRTLAQVKTEELAPADRATFVSLVRLCQTSLERRTQASENFRLAENHDTQQVNKVFDSFAKYSRQTPGDSPEVDRLAVVSLEPDSIVLSEPYSSEDTFTKPSMAKAWQETSNAQRVTISIFSGDKSATFKPQPALRKP